MASIQIPNLTAAISVSGAEQMEAVQSGSSVRVTIQQIADLAGSQYGLTPIPDLTLLGNLSGVSALPTSYTLSQFLDSSFSNTQGAVIYRGPSSWQALAPGANGQVLRTNGTGADVSWYTVPGGGTVQSITAGTNLSVSGSANPITLAGTIDTVMNPAFTTSVTTPSIYGGSSASQTLLIQSTTGVGTSDSIVFKVGNNGAITAMTIASDGTVTIPQAAIDTTSITVPLLIGGTTASSTLTLESTSGAGTSDAIIFKTGSQTERMRIRSDGGVSIGGTGASTVGLYLQKNITGTTTSYGILANGSVQNDVTSAAYNFLSQSNIASGTAVTSYAHFRATEGTISGSMTNQLGFVAESDLISATANYGFRANNTAAVGAGKTAYGFYSAVNTATGGGTTYGFYAAGTANNYFEGNVGIGTASPSVKLNVVGGATSGAIDDAALFSGGVAGVSGSGSAIYLSGGAGVARSAVITGVNTSGASNAHAMVFSTSANSAAPTERMRIDSSGNVGIGTSSPAYPLDVSGTGIARINPTTGTNQATLLAQNTGGNFYFAKNNSAGTSYGTDAYASVLWSSGAYPMVMATNGTERMRIDSSGNVGIGTSSPSQELHVYKDQNSATEILIENPNTGTGGRAQLQLLPELGAAYFTANSSTSTVAAIAGGALGAGLYTSSGLSNGLSVGTTAGALKFFAGSTSAERMRIDSSGNAFIGATAATWDERLGVRPSGTGTVGIGAYSSSASYTGSLFRAQAENTTGASFKLYEGRGSGGSINYWVDGAGGAYFAGNVGIGPSGTSAGTNLLTNANITGGITAYAHLNNGVIQSGVTSIGGSFVSNMSSAAAAFTTTSAVHFWANPNVGGAGSIITNQYGFLASSTVGTQGGATVTNAYGFYGDIASATNRWNLYMGGTANNYMAGRLGLNSTSLTSVAVRNNLTITGAVTAYAHYTEGEIASDVTNAAYGYSSNISLNSASTTTTVAHFFVNPPAGAASSTITNHYGILINDNLRDQGAATVTNAYGISSQLVAATNAYNLYMSGTANNYFAGYSFGLGGVQYTTTSTATNTATLTATQVASGFIVGTPTATASYTLPTVANLETELGNVAIGYNFEFVVFTTAAFAITLLTATGWTLVGSMATGATANSVARFRARKTGASTWSLYRV